MIKAILFDLDGTLLSMDQEKFTEEYFRALSNAMEKHGYFPEYLVKAIWKATGAMVRNDGRATNEEVFWSALSKFYEKM